MSNSPATTSELYWLSAGMLTLVDLTAIYCLSQCIPAARFRKVSFEISLVSLLFWGGLWSALMANDYVWEWCYCYVFSQTERWLMPPLMALLYSALSYGMWKIAMRLPFQPVITFSVLGAIISLPDHYYAIFVKDVLATPLLSNVSAVSAFVFGVFEFVFYWVVILSIAIFARSVLEWWTHGRHNLFKYMLRS